MARNCRLFIPRLESFDERSLPSVTIIESGGDLQIIGDDAGNNIVIRDDGTANAGNVIVVADGQTYQTVGAVDFIVIQTGRGVDKVDYTMTGALAGNRTVVADLGARADTFTANVSGATVAPNSRFIIQAFGDGGGDNLTADAQNVNVGANALFEVDLVGGKAKDTLTANFVPGNVDPTANVVINVQQK